MRLLTGAPACSHQCQAPWETAQAQGSFPSCPCAFPVEFQLQLPEIKGGAAEASIADVAPSIAQGLGLEASQVVLCQVLLGTPLAATWWLIPGASLRFSATQLADMRSVLQRQEASLSPAIGTGYRLLAFTQLGPPSPPPRSTSWPSFSPSF